MKHIAIRLSPRFTKQLKKFKKKDNALAQRVVETLKRMGKDPFHPVLRTYKVQSRNFEQAWSSRVTGDVRIIWDFIDAEATIMALDVGGHSTVY